MLRVQVSPPDWLGWGIIFGDAREYDRGAIAEFGDQRESTAHRLDRLAQGGQEKIAALFKARNAILGNPEDLGHSDLGKLACVPQLTQRHFLGNQLGPARLYFSALRGRKPLDLIIDVHRHWSVPSFHSRKMAIETLVSFPNQLPVEALLTETRFIARHKQDRLALGIEGEGYSPFTIRRAEAQFFHVGVAGPIKRINARAP